MSDELDIIIAGLRKTQKMLSPKYFYDDHGSKIF